MDPVAGLRQRATALSAEVDAIYATALAGNRALNAEETTSVQAKTRELEPLVQTITDHDAHAATRARLLQPVSAPEGPAAGMQARAPQQPGRPIRVGDDRALERPFNSLGEQLHAIRSAYIGGAEPDRRLYRLNEAYAAASGLNEGIGSEGGFAVQTDFVSSIVDPLFQTGESRTTQILSRINNIPLGPNSNGIKQNVIDETSRVTGSRWGGVQMYWRAEAETVTASKPKLRQIQMDLESLIGIWYLTEELEQDQTSLTATAERAFRSEVQFMLEDGIVNGTGVGRPLGITTSGALVQVAIEATQTIANTATFIATNVAKMYGRFLGNEQSAVWLAHRSLLPKLVVATIGSTTPVYLPAGNIAGTPFGTILGIPCFFVEYCAAEGTVGDLLLIDPMQYMGIQKGGAQVQSSIHVRFLYAENAFRITYRFNGQPVWNTAVTPYKGSETRSPFIALALRS